MKKLQTIHILENLEKGLEQNTWQICLTSLIVSFKKKVCLEIFFIFLMPLLLFQSHIFGKKGTKLSKMAMTN